MSESALSKSRKRSWLVPVLGVLVLVAGAVAGFSVWRMQHTAAATAEAPVEAAPVFYPMDTFTVNLGDADRVLYIGITLRLADEASRRRINDYLPEVRSRLLLLFSRQDAAQLATEQGKQALIAAIKATLTPPLVKNQPQQKVDDVLYTAFILR